MTTNRMYIMPGPLGGQELEPIRLDDDGWDFFKWPLGSNLSAELRLPARLATPALPEEPPYKAVMLDDDGQAWQRFAPDHSTNLEWSCAGEGADENWEGLQQYGPLTRLVPDPFVVEPVALPWERWLDGARVVRVNCFGHPPFAPVLSLEADQRKIVVELSQAEARAIAAALMAANDAADKAGS